MRLHQGTETQTKTEQRYQDNLARRNTIEASIDFGKRAPIIHYHKCRRTLIYTNHTPHLRLPRPPLSPLRLKTLQPPRQRIRENAPRHCPTRKRRPEIIAMLRTRQHIAKQLPRRLLVATARRVLEQLHAGGEGLRACGRERAPRVEFAIGPVCV